MEKSMKTGTIARQITATEIVELQKQAAFITKLQIYNDEAKKWQAKTPIWKPEARMGACREGYDLKKKHGRKAFWHRIRSLPWEYVVKDTIGPYLCWVFGHGERFKNEDIPPLWFCKRCCRRV